MSQPDFIHLRVHSSFSLAEGAIRVDELVGHCQKVNMPAVAVTDSGNLFGAYQFSKSAAKKGIKPLVGCLLQLKWAAHDPRHEQHRIRDIGFPKDEILLLAMNQTGYQNLIRLSSASFRGGVATPEHGNGIDWDLLEKYSEGLICLSGGHKGPLGQLLLKGFEEAALDRLKAFEALFKDRFYIELSRIGLEEEKGCEDKLIELAYAHTLPLVATNEAFYLSPELYEAHDALLCISAGAYISQEDRRKSHPNYYFQTAAAMKQRFEDLPEALENTVLIARRCNFLVEESAPLLPNFPVQTSERAELQEQGRQGLTKRLLEEVFKDTHSDEEKEALRTQYEKRLSIELGIIDKMGFNGYFLIVADFIKWAKMQAIAVGPGRGSGAGSIVAWSLTITDVDPIRFDLLFERFLNPERVSMPDFDIDFCQERRDEVIDYVCQKYGHDHVAQIITFGKLQARAVVRDVGRVLQISYGKVDQLCKLIPNNPASPTTLPQAIEQEAEIQKQQQDDPVIAKLLDIGVQLEGLYRHASTHAAGVVIGQKPLEETVGLYYDSRSSLPATQFNMKDVEEVGLVKFDFLGLKTLTVIQKTLEFMEHRGESLDISKIPLEDDKTFKMLQRVETVGVFQLESAGMRDVLERLRPDRFEDLIALVALYRPGPMDDIPRYLACKHGQEPVYFEHPLLEPILKETFGVMVYQEQVMKIAQVLSGYSLGDADLLRRAMGKKIKREMEAQRKIFVDGAINNGVKKPQAARIFDQAAKFAGYGFNKCHATPYALIAYQTAYLKANAPVEFLAGSMCYELNNTDKLNIFRQESERLGIKILPPCVNRSEANFSVDKDAAGNPAIRYALAAVKNVGETAMEQVVQERRDNGPYASVIDFAQRLDSKSINKRLLEHFILAGAFDSLEPNRQRLFKSVDFILSHGGAILAAKKTRQTSLFGSGESSLELPEATLPPCDPWSMTEQLRQEFQALGFYLSSHPLKVYEDLTKSLNVLTAKDLDEKTAAFKERFETFKIAGVLIGRVNRTARSGSKFAFLQCTDSTGYFEIPIFSEAFESKQEILQPGELFIFDIQGRSEKDQLRLSIQNVKRLEEIAAQQRNTALIEIEDKAAVRSLEKVLRLSKPGRSKILLRSKHHDLTLTQALPQEVMLNNELTDAIRQIPGVVDLHIEKCNAL